MFKKLISLFFISTVCFYQAEAQTPNLGNLMLDYHPVTPQEFQFIKYTDMPVSEYSGIPEIGVPLYEIDVDGIKIPVNLSYHSKGIMVNQDASWVGLGWDMTFGSIVQIINDQDDFGGDIARGRPDFYDSPTPSPLPMVYQCDGTHSTDYTNPYPSDYATYGNIIYPYNTYEISFSNYLPVGGSYGITNQSSMLGDNNFDSEPDIFKANFLGYSVNFRLNWTTNQIEVVNQQGFAVNHQSDGTWEIIVPSGDQYYFDVTTSVSTSNASWTNMSGVSGETVPSSNMWMLSKIVTNKGREIDFNYNISSSTYQTYPNFSETFYYTTLSSDVVNNSSYEVTNFNAYFQDLTPPAVTAYALHTGSMVALNSSENTENHITLSSINFPSGSLQFYTSPARDRAGDVKLDSFALFDLGSNWIKSFGFNYTYFDVVTAADNGLQMADVDLTTTFDDLDGLRLKLLSVDMPDGSNYSFNYDNTPLPHKNSCAQDYWGYYNGALSNTTLVPNPTQFTTNPAVPSSYQTLAASLPANSDNHSANLAYAQAGILNQIVYPDGGSTNFTYELNQFNNYWMPDFSSTTNTLTSGNGLRIKTVQFQQADGSNSKTTNYYYYGGVDMLTRYLFTHYYLNYTFQMYPCSSAAQLEERVYDVTVMDGGGSFSASLLSSFQGVGYDSVTVEDVDASGISNGKTTTEYNNTADETGPVLENTLMMYIKMPAFKNVNLPENGTPTLITSYDASGNIVKQVSNSYINYTSSLDYGARIFGYCNYVCGGGPAVCFDPRFGIPLLSWSSGLEFVIGDYPLQDCKSYLASRTETDYFTSGHVAKTTSYTYDENGNVSQELYTNSEGETDQTTYSYPANYVTSSASNPYSIMVNNNMLSSVIEKTHIKEKDGAVSYNGEIHTYQAYSPSLILKDAIYQTESANPYISPGGSATYNGSPSFGSLNMNSYYVLKNSILYDGSGMPTSITSETNIQNALIWDYNDDFVTAEVKNASNTFTNNGFVYSPIEYLTQTYSLPGIGITTTPTINVDTAGPITLNLEFNPSSPTPSTIDASFNLLGPGMPPAVGSLCNTTEPVSSSACSSMPSFTWASGVSNIGTYNVGLTWTGSDYADYNPDITVTYPHSTSPPYIGYYTMWQKISAAYTSFECLNSTDFSNGSGNIVGILPANVVFAPGQAATGSYYYTLTGTSLAANNLDNTKQYVASYWSDSGPYTILALPNISTGNSITIGGKTWTYYEHSGNSLGITQIYIAGSGNIDEFRIYPSNGAMKTYTYQPLIGITSICDENNMITRYEYDFARRLYIVTDANGNVLSKYEYGIQVGE